MFNEPIFFERNRVGRVYIGGKLFANFFGDEAKDGYYPEEWIASSVRAINKGSRIYKEGVSRVRHTGEYFDELVEKYPFELLGKQGKLRILVKILDSGIRLPAQAHPDKEFSKKHFNSSYGKTECWTILDTRQDAKIFFGFNDGVTKEAFVNAIDKSEHDKDAMENLMRQIHPDKNEVYFVPSRTVHAIGKGCLILEVQEPTDFTIQPERYCGEYRLSDEEMYLGLTREQAISCFDFNVSPQAKLEPTILSKTDGVIIESLVGAKHTDCFVINRINLNDGRYNIELQDSYGIYIVCDGRADIIADNYNETVKKGDYFFMPACAMGHFSITGNAKIIECY